MAVWNPWRGCRRFSEGCKNCYIHKGDARRGVDTSQVVRTAEFGKPLERLKNGNFRMKSGLVYLCFNSDFLIAEADSWRPECRRMIRRRQRVSFRFRQCGTYTVKDGKKYTLRTGVLRAQAKKAGIDLIFP